MKFRNPLASISPENKRTVHVMLIIIVLILCIVPTVWWRNTLKAESRMNMANNSSDSSLNLSLDVKLLRANPEEFRYSLVLSLMPRGSLSNNIGNLIRFNESVQLYVKGETYRFVKNDPISVIDFTTYFSTGSSNSYPFDSYSDVFDISAIILSDTKSGIITPLDVKFSGSFDSYDATFYKETVGSKTTFHIRIERSGTTRFFSICVIMLMWCLSFTILTLAVQTCAQDKVVEAPTIVVAAGLLFATPQVRNVQPGIPIIGCAADALGFFWNMLLISVALLLLMWKYITKNKTLDKSEDQTLGMSTSAKMIGESG